MTCRLEYLAICNLYKCSLVIFRYNKSPVDVSFEDSGKKVGGKRKENVLWFESWILVHYSVNSMNTCWSFPPVFHETLKFVSKRQVLLCVNSSQQYDPVYPIFKKESLAICQCKFSPPSLWSIKNHISIHIFRKKCWKCNQISYVGFFNENRSSCQLPILARVSHCKDAHWYSLLS